jgi:hypothetical protein
MLADTLKKGRSSGMTYQQSPHSNHMQTHEALASNWDTDSQIKNPRYLPRTFERNRLTGLSAGVRRT